MTSGTPDLRALVTGASSGIGAAFARALKARGERLILVARRADRLHSLAQELGGEGEATVLPFDLGQAGSGARLEAAVRERGLAVDLLVNNAGFGDSGHFAREDPARLAGMVDLNARAVVELTRAFVPGMIERRRGRIVNVASTAAFQPCPFLAVYAASKAFVLAFTEALHEELAGTGVRVQALCPGLTETEFQQVAHTDHVPFNKTPAMKAEDVVAWSLAGLDRGRLRVIAGWQNRLTVAAQRLVPQTVVRKIAGRMLRPPQSPA